MPGAHARHTQVAWLILLICQRISVSDDWPFLWGKKKYLQGQGINACAHADRGKKGKWEDRLSARCATRIMIEIM